jgi:hypothetical protein
MSTTEVQRRITIINGVTDPIIRTRLLDAAASSSFIQLYKHLVK